MEPDLAGSPFSARQTKGRLEISAAEICAKGCAQISHDLCGRRLSPLQTLAESLEQSADISRVRGSFLYLVRDLPGLARGDFRLIRVPPANTAPPRLNKDLAAFWAFTRNGLSWASLVFFLFRQRREDLAKFVTFAGQALTG
jgi:hypothetical protein